MHSSVVLLLALVAASASAVVQQDDPCLFFSFLACVLHEFNQVTGSDRASDTRLFDIRLQSSSLVILLPFGDTFEDQTNASLFDSSRLCVHVIIAYSSFASPSVHLLN